MNLKMRKLAVFLSLLMLCSALSLPLMAEDPSSSASQGSSEASSSETSSEEASSESASDDEASPSSEGENQEEQGTSLPGDSSDSNKYSLPVDMQIQSQAIYLMNLDSGEVLQERNSQVKMQPAALTKIMTCIIALESDINLDAEKTELKTYIQNELYNIGGGQADGIVRGENLTIRDLLYAMMLQSGDSAAMMVADYISDGAPEYFFELMNNKAKEVGAMNTNFANATGLYNEASYTTAYDMAKIVEYAVQNEEFMEIVTTRTYTSQPTEMHPNGITWVSNNSMQNPSDTDYYIEGVKGVMSGSLTTTQTRNAASIATRDGYTYLLICMGAPMTAPESGERYMYNLAWLDSAKLYNWAFSSFEVKTLVEIGERFGEIPVKYNWEQDKVFLLAANKFASLVPKETTEESLEPVMDIPEYLEAPVKKGDKVGSVKLMVSGVEVGRVDLVAESNVDRSATLYYLDQVKQFCNQFIFKFLITFLIVIILAYIGLMILRNHNRRRYKYQRPRKRPSQQRINPSAPTPAPKRRQPSPSSQQRRRRPRQ